MSEPRPLHGHAFERNDRLFLDANVWYYIHGPQSPTDGLQAIYSLALKRMFAAHSNIYTDILVLSEFINAWARNEYQERRLTMKFKNFRRSREFAPVAAAIADATRRILGSCAVIGSDLPPPLLTQLLLEFATGNIDFNDQIIREICVRERLQLITHDADFGNPDIPILTANPCCYSESCYSESCYSESCYSESCCDESFGGLWCSSGPIWSSSGKKPAPKCGGCSA